MRSEYNELYYSYMQRYQQRIMAFCRQNGKKRMKKSFLYDAFSTAQEKMKKNLS